MAKNQTKKKPQDFLHLLDAIELVHGRYKFYLGVFQSVPIKILFSYKGSRKFIFEINI